MSITIGIADDHKLFIESLTTLVNTTFKQCSAIVTAANGIKLLEKLEAGPRPEIILLDVNMPGMDGIKAAQVIAKKYPEIKLAALTSHDDDITIISMLKAGCCAYLTKDIDPRELERALEEISTKGFYNADSVNIRYRRLIVRHDEMDECRINDREMAFLKLACSDMTYKQIAAEMNLSERTIDGYREALFAKLNVQSRVGMAMEAIRRKFIQI